MRLQGIVESVSARRRRQRVVAAYKAGLASAAGRNAGASAGTVFEPPQLGAALDTAVGSKLSRTEPRTSCPGVAAALFGPPLTGMSRRDAACRDHFTRELRKVCPNAATRFVQDGDLMQPHADFLVADTPGVAGAASPCVVGAAQSYNTKPSVRNAEQQTHGVHHITDRMVVHSTKIVEDVAKAMQMNSEAVLVLGHRLEQAVCNMSQVVQLSSSVTQNLAMSTQAMAMTSSGMLFSHQAPQPRSPPRSPRNAHVSGSPAQIGMVDLQLQVETLTKTTQSLVLALDANLHKLTQALENFVPRLSHPVLTTGPSMVEQPNMPSTPGQEACDRGKPQGNGWSARVISGTQQVQQVHTGLSDHDGPATSVSQPTFSEGPPCTSEPRTPSETVPMQHGAEVSNASASAGKPSGTSKLPATCAAPPISSSAFPVGTAVVIHGLTSEAGKHLNWRCGDVVRGPDPSSGRVGVIIGGFQIPGQGPKSISPANLRLLGPNSRGVFIKHALCEPCRPTRPGLTSHVRSPLT